MRPLALCWLLASSTAMAAVAVAPFAAPDDLTIFAPEVARVVAAALDRAGVDVQLDGSSSVGQVDGKIEIVDADRVRLRASMGGQSVDVVGELERIDVLANQLGTKLAAALPPSVRRSPGAPSKTVVAALPVGRAGERLGGARPPATVERTAQPPTIVPVRPAAQLRDAPVAPAATAPSSLPTPPNPHPSVEKPVPSVHPASVASPPTWAESPAAVPVVPPLAPPVRGSAGLSAPATPPPYPGMGSTPAASPPTYGGVRRGGRYGGNHGGAIGRAALHTIGTPHGCATGSWATYAARDVLERRLRVQTVSSSSCGFTAREAATAEASRLGVRSVVMASFESLGIDGKAGSLHAVGRLRILVVRDGKVVFDRSPDVAPRPIAVADLSRAAYDLVGDAFGAVAGDLQAALAEAE